VAVSDLSRLECRVRPLRDGQHETLALYDAFFSADDLTIVPLSPKILDLATSIRARTKLRTPDALQAACCLVPVHLPSH
jgi:predicted nucleic acid-binding protein